MSGPGASPISSTTRVTGAGLTVRWANVRDAVIHAFDDNGIQFSSRFSNTKTEATGSGTVVSRLVTVIRHLNGTLCIGYVGDTGIVG